MHASCITAATCSRAAHRSLAVQRRSPVVRASAADEPIQAPVADQTLSALPEVATVPTDVGEKVQEWLKTPFDFAAFGPRLTVGAIMSAPDKLNSLSGEISKATEVLNSPAPPEDKAKTLAAQLETLTTECLEKGADVEADVFRQVKAALPQDVAEKIETPETPVSKARAEAEAASAPSSPAVTELPDDIDLN